MSVPTRVRLYLFVREYICITKVVSYDESAPSWMCICFFVPWFFVLVLWSFAPLLATDISVLPILSYHNSFS